jgi:hypothetical protein
MSLAAVLQAVQDRLRQPDVGFTDNECQCQEDGQPNPNFGKRFVAIHPLAWKPGDIPDGMEILDEVYDIGVTITLRAPIAPEDVKMKELFLKNLKGFEPLLRKIIIALHKRPELIQQANALLPDFDTRPIIEYLRWQGNDPAPVPRTGDWIFSTAQSESIAAWTMTAYFGGARRIQAVGADITEEE